MKRNKFFKFLEAGLSLFVALLFIALLYSFWQTRELSNRFKRTKLNISKRELIKIWGKPDREFDLGFNDDKRYIVKYKDCFGYAYIFVSKKDEEIISEKYIDD